MFGFHKKDKSDKIKKQRLLTKHLASLGFTNRLAIYLVIFLLIGLIGGMVLAYLSIIHDYTGQLLCWTIVFTPIGTAVAIVLGKVVDKNRDENTSKDGDGISYAIARANNFPEWKDEADLLTINDENVNTIDENSPPV